MDEKLNETGNILDNATAASTKPVELSEQEYVNISQSKEYRALVKRKRNFILPITIFFMLFYFTLPILTSFTTVLDSKAIGDITWVWIFAAAQFIMVWTLVTVYVRNANKFDKDANAIIKKAKDGDYK